MLLLYCYCFRSAIRHLISWFTLTRIALTTDVEASLLPKYTPYDISPTAPELLYSVIRLVVPLHLQMLLKKLIQRPPIVFPPRYLAITKRIQNIGNIVHNSAQSLII